MSRFFILKDGKIEADTATRKEALTLLRLYQEDEKKKHQFLWANYSIIEGAQEHIPYE